MSTLADPNNDDRAQWGKDCLTRLMRLTGCYYEDSLGDLLANLMHLSDRDGFDFEAALSRARMHYEAETEEERT